MKTKLNIGCGKDVRQDYLNVDCVNLKGVDKVCDLNKFPWPFKDNTFDEVLAFNIIEHLNDAYKVFEELHRICKNNAIIRLIVPHFSSFSCWGDIQHKRGFSVESFNRPNMADKFEIARIKVGFPWWFKSLFEKIVNRFAGFYETHLAYIFTSGDIHAELKVRKNKKV